MSIKWIDREHLNREISSHILPCNIAVDIGTGIRPNDLIQCVVYICCEPYLEYVDVLRSKTDLLFDRIYVIEQKTWAETIDCFPEGSVDSIFLIDVIEHLPKEEGRELLRLTEGKASKQIVIFTPLGFIEQHTLEGGKDAWGLNGAEWQGHKSGWMPEDFDESWEIFACINYHEYNNIGEKLENPFGAFWAIKSLSGRQPEHSLPLAFRKEIFRQVKVKLSRVSSCIAEKNMIEDRTKSILLQERERIEILSQENVEFTERQNALLKKLEELSANFNNLENRYSTLDSMYKNLEMTKSVRFARFIRRNLFPK